MISKQTDARVAVVLPAPSDQLAGYWLRRSHFLLVVTSEAAAKLLHIYVFLSLYIYVVACSSLTHLTRAFEDGGAGKKLDGVRAHAASAPGAARLRRRRRLGLRPGQLRQRQLRRVASGFRS